MITLQSATVAVVDVGSTNWAFPSGTWTFDSVVRVKGYTNDWVDVSFLRDGAIITVDSSGWVGFADGPNTLWAAERGIILAILVVGGALLFRFLFRLLRPKGGIAE